ncbi:SDR family oxidoreductase [Candidatus Roizmanbacteria bacterium]|nr:SDR family oxidoreductase [Candidatus Roizmanbacteria bacterium]
MEIKKILVTGDQGYIGAVLVPMLIKTGYEVIGLDTEYFSDGLEKAPDYKNIKKDIRKLTIKDLRGVDAVIHLAALSNDPMGEVNPSLTKEINLIASRKLIRLSKKVGVKRFIFSSSCSIYGIAGGTVDENSKVNPQTAYAESKIKVEKYLQKLADRSFCVCLLRNSTVYGYSPKFRNDLVVNNFVTCALALGKIKIMSDGTPWRPLIDVRDLSRIFMEFLTIDAKKVNREIINIGFNENNFQVKDVLNIVSKNLPECKIEYTGEHGADTRSYKVNFDKFKKFFPDYKKQWPLDKSVKDLIDKLRKFKYNKDDFTTGRFTRLAVLKKLLGNKKIDQDLFLS